MNIFKAASKGDVESIKKLLSEGTKVNSTDNSGRTALIEAAWGGHSDAVVFLLEKKADVNITDSSGFSALMRACEEGFTDIVKVLLKKGADPNARGNVKGTTPLMLAAEKGNLEICELLIEHGAKINAVDQYEETALARAYHFTHSKIAEFLESKGGRGKPERSSFSNYDRDLRPVTKATVPKLSSSSQDIAPFEDEEIDIGGGDDDIGDE